MTFLVVPLAGVVAMCLCVAWWLADQLLALHVFHSTHVVYFLLDRQGAVLYVGSTDDLERRYDEHTTPDEQSLEPWRRRVRGVALVRHCRSQRQARRVERRMIRALIVASERGLCPRLKNEVYSGRPSSAGRPWRALWVAAYWLNGVAFPLTRWHRPNPSPPRRVVERVDPWEGWEPTPPDDDDIVDAEIVSEPGQHVSILALPPVGGPSQAADADGPADSPADNVFTLAGRVQASHRRHIDTTRLGGPDGAEARAERRREQNRQAQARARAKRRASQ